MLDKRTFVWNKLNDLVLNDYANEIIDESEMESRLDGGETINDHEELIEYAESLGYQINIPRGYK